MSTQGRHLSGHVPSSASAVILSAREYEYLRLKALGLTKKEIAAELGVAQSTVNQLLWRSHSKLDVSSAIQAFRVLGWLSVPAERGAK